MGVSVLILGESGNGKSRSLVGFEPEEVGIFNVVGKPLPFRKKLPKADHADYPLIDRTLHANQLRCYVIDDAGYLMQFDNFRRAGQKGYDKFVDMAVNFEQLLEAANATDEDTITYFLMHPDYDTNGRMKPKSIGKMLDEKLTIEGMFPIVLVAKHTDDGYFFETNGDVNSPAKSPEGMFAEQRIPNDLKAVDTAIRDYWDMRPIVEPKAPQKEPEKPEEGKQAKARTKE